MSRFTLAAIAVGCSLTVPTMVSGQVLDKIFKDWKPGEVVKSTLPHKFGAPFNGPHPPPLASHFFGARVS